MAKTLSNILLLSFLILASLFTAKAVKYAVINNVPNLPGGQRFDQLIGVQWTIKLMGTINKFIWKVFEQNDAASRKTLPVLTVYISNFNESWGYTNINAINVSAPTIASWPDQVQAYFTGLMYHEMTHIFQWSGEGTAPGGLTEGVAEYVKIKAGYGRGSKPGEGERWDEGYDVTARFLEYCDSLKPKFTVTLNKMMRKVYKDSYFQDLLGKPLPQLWNEYKAKYSNASADSQLI